MSKKISIKMVKVKMDFKTSLVKSIYLKEPLQGGMQWDYIDVLIDQSETFTLFELHMNIALPL
jgi:hypothetical protein